MKRCNHGHFYDESKHTMCPYCGVLDEEVNATIRKRPTDPDSSESVHATKRIEDPRKDSLQGETIRVVKKQTGVDPVVGWLVCTSGPETGRDYRIRSERNFVGRSPAMDICIQGDEAISRENHAIISYNPRSMSFSLVPGDSRGLVYINGVEILQATALSGFDEIEFGQSRFLFVPLCGDRFQWPSE